MAPPRTLRLLGGLSLLVFLYVAVLIYRSPGGRVSRPSIIGPKLDDMLTDPNLERECSRPTRPDLI